MSSSDRLVRDVPTQPLAADGDAGGVVVDANRIFPARPVMDLPLTADGARGSIIRGRGLPPSGGSSKAAGAGARAASAYVMDGTLSGSIDLAGERAALAAQGDGKPKRIVPALDVKKLRAAAEQLGYTDGRARADAEIAQAVAAITEMGRQIEATAPRESHAIAREITELALVVARRVIDAELHADPTVLCGTIEAAIASVDARGEVRVLLHADLVEPIRSAWVAAHGHAFLGRSWVFEADQSLALHECVLRYDHGHVEIGVEEQLKALRGAIDIAVAGLLDGEGA